MAEERNEFPSLIAYVGGTTLLGLAVGFGFISIGFARMGLASISGMSTL